MNRYNISEAKKDFSYIIQQIESGTQSEVLIDRNGKTVAKIVSVKDAGKAASNRIGFAKGKLSIGEEFDRTFDELDNEITAQCIGGTL